MDRLAIKISTVIVSVGDQLLRYRSVSDVPDDIREKVNEALSGPNVGTIIIADEAGRREIASARSYNEGGTAVLDDYDIEEMEKDRWNG